MLRIKEQETQLILHEHDDDDDEDDDHECFVRMCCIHIKLRKKKFGSTG